MTVLAEVTDLEIEGAGTIVQPTSLTVRAGVPLTILGETGCGKTLLAQAIMGNLPEGLAARGRVVIGGQEFDAAETHGRRSLWGREITILPQEPWLALDPTMRAEHQIEETYRFVRALPAKESHERSQRDIAALALNGAAGKLPMELSGGMAQRVAFAAARAGGARIVIADEPTKGLDLDRRDEAVALLRTEAEAEGGLLAITHDVEVARGLGGEVAVMLEGEIIERGPASRVLENPQASYTRTLLAARPSAWAKRANANVADEVILEAEGLGKSRGGSQLFQDFDIAVRAGEIVGVCGPSGSGKSTLGDILLGLLRPDAGAVRRQAGIAVPRFQKLYQDPPAAFSPHVTLGRSLEDLRKLHDFDPAKLEVLLRRLKLDPALLGRHPAHVSGGELQRLALLRVLLLDPVFLFADEPTSRLDLVTQQQTIELIVELAREQACAVLLVSHDNALIEKTSDRIIRLS